MLKKDDFFEKNKVYKIVRPFKSGNNLFEAEEELLYKGCQFIPYDEAWSYAFTSKQGVYKYLIVWCKEDLNIYTKEPLIKSKKCGIMGE